MCNYAHAHSAHAYTCTRIHVNTHTREHAPIGMHVLTHTHSAHTQTHIPKYVHVYARDIHARGHKSYTRTLTPAAPMHTCSRTCNHTHARTRTSACLATHTHRQADTRVHLHTHTRAHSRICSHATAAAWRTPGLGTQAWTQGRMAVDGGDADRDEDGTAGWSGRVVPGAGAGPSAQRCTEG